MKFFVVGMLIGFFTGCQSVSSSNTPSPPAESSPTVSTDFASDEGLWDLQLLSGGTIDFGASETEAEDGWVAKIVLAGDPSLGVADAVGPSHANQIALTEATRFGTYRVRLQPAACEAGEEVVNGIFVYANDGSDLNGNGIRDNSEIDIEILCGEPNALYLTSWTDYTDDDHFFKVTRKVDLETGNYYQTVAGEEDRYGLSDAPAGTLDAAVFPGFSATSDFYEIGFEWQSSRIRFFIVIDGQEITLWSFTDARFIPQYPARFMLNLWHSDEHWYGGEADYPSADAVMTVDWYRYWEG